MEKSIKREATYSDLGKFADADALTISVSEAVDRIGQGEKFEYEEIPPIKYLLWLGDQLIGRMKLAGTKNKSKA